MTTVIKINEDEVVVDGVKYKREEPDIVSRFSDIARNHRNYQRGDLEDVVKSCSSATFHLHLPPSNTRWLMVLMESLVQLEKELPLYVQVCPFDSYWNLRVAIPPR